jgi:phytoene/squalene synthetase
LWASSTILSGGVTEVLGESMSDLRTARDRALRLYDATAARTSAGVLAAYSTSFGLGTRLLGRRAQEDIRAVYALVRLADEVVDTYRGEDAGAELDELEEQTARALRTGYSTNLVVHAFARTARRVGIGAAETEPFFASMRADLTVREHDRRSYEAYVYGSAEVVGLMCVRAFLNEDRRPGQPVREPDQLQVAGARALGAAFQKINFLRDLGADTQELGRTYFPGTTPGHLDDAQLHAILREITDDVETARAAVPSLPRRARYAVGATLALYQRLLDEIASRPPEQLLVGRVRLPTPVKLLVVGESVLTEARAGRAAEG